jgi:two-component system, NtrC family, response regulator HydG
MATKATILLVDDDERLLRAAGRILAAANYAVLSANSGREALAALESHPVGLAICDLRLPDIDGTTLLQQMRRLRADMEVVMVTGHGSVEMAVEAMRLGAYDFIEKPLDSTGLLKVVAKAIERQGLSRENKRLRMELELDHGPEALIGGSSKMEAIRALVRQAAPAGITVLIQGESGTGKELVANALHNLSGRSDGPLIKISCAAIPETLLESELFGYERGAFTGAGAAKPGKFELADGGTLLLDEIAEMSPALQAKLLRVLQDGRFQRLGGTKELHPDIRLLAATHADVPRAMAEGKFRADLYYRINTLQISLPALRDRTEDIPLLASHFLKRSAIAMNKPVRTIDPRAMEQLLSHAWPGNVRELEHVIESAVALCPGGTIESFSFAPAMSGPAVPTAPGTPQVSLPIGITMEEATKRLIQATVEQCGGNKLQAARILGIPPRTMYRHFADLEP